MGVKETMEAFERFKEKNPGECIVKREIVSNIARRSGWIMQTDYDPIYDIEAIAPPDERFILNNWSEICLRAAEKYKKYIVWEPRIGVRLGSFEEYQKIPETTLANICQGLMDNAESRAKIIVTQGGRSIVMSIQIKQLKSGLDGKNGKEATE